MSGYTDEAIKITEVYALMDLNQYFDETPKELENYICIYRDKKDGTYLPYTALNISKDEFKALIIEVVKLSRCSEIELVDILKMIGL